MISKRYVDFVKPITQLDPNGKDYVANLDDGLFAISEVSREFGKEFISTLDDLQARLRAYVSSFKEITPLQQMVMQYGASLLPESGIVVLGSKGLEGLVRTELSGTPFEEFFDLFATHEEIKKARDAYIHAALHKLVVRPLNDFNGAREKFSLTAVFPDSVYYAEGDMQTLTVGRIRFELITKNAHLVTDESLADFGTRRPDFNGYLGRSPFKYLPEQEALPDMLRKVENHIMRQYAFGE